MNKEFEKLVNEFKEKVENFERKNKVKTELNFEENYFGFKEYTFKLIVDD